MGKNILFLCYSRYVIFTAYLLKKQLGENNSFRLLISDTLGNDNGIAEYISTLKMWDQVGMIYEKGLQYEEIKEQIDTYMRDNTIDVFCVSHIMRYSSHYFLKKLPQSVEVNLFDEGIISLDLLNGYKYWSRRGLPLGWPDFDFDRVDNFYVLFSKITESIGKANIKELDIKKLFQKDLEGVVEELNLLFNYTYEPIDKEIVIIDADVAAQGSITQNYENHCIENMMRELDCDKCIIKVKPSVSQQLLDEKYGKFNVAFMKNGLVPFEVIYLNCVIHKQLPKMFVALPTTLLWNLILINQILGVETCKMVSLANIMKDYYFVPGNAEDMMRRVGQYQYCFGEKYKIELPETWSEYASIVKTGQISPTEEQWIEEQEKNWIVNEYKMLLNKPSNLGSFEKNRNRVLRKWITMVYEKKRIASFFERKGVEEIVLYGSGEFATFLLRELQGEVIKISDVIKTMTDGKESFNGYTVQSVESYSKSGNEKKIPIVLTAVGKEKEQLQVLLDWNVEAPCFKIEDILDEIL